MSEENVEVVRDQYAATNERDFARAMSHYADDVELVVPRTSAILGGELLGGKYKGKDAVGRWFGDWFLSFARDSRFEVKEMTQLSDGSVLVVADFHARGRASGVEVHRQVVWHYRLRDGKIVRVHSHESRDEALEAAGVSE